MVIIASLAIGIGTNTAIFSVTNALMLKPLPYPDPGRLAVLWLRSPGLNILQDWRAARNGTPAHPGRNVASIARIVLLEDHADIDREPLGPP